MPVFFEMLETDDDPAVRAVLERRDAYMAALEAASVGQDIIPFSRFIGGLVEDGLAGRATARLPEDQQRSVVRSPDEA